MAKENIGVEITPADLGDPVKTEKPAREKTEKPAREKTEKEIERENERLKAKAYENEQLIKRLERELEASKEPKRKPGITVVNEEGEQEKRKRPNSWGLSDLIMPPFTKGRVAIYKICGADAINPATNQPVEPVDVLIPGEYSVYDKFDRDPLRRQKPVRNVVRTDRKVVEGEVKMEPIIEDVVFQRGWLQVPVESNFPLYVFMELHPNNVNNKHRPNNAPGIFERVDINYKSAASLGATLDLGIQAANEVTDMNKEDILSYAASVPAPSTIPTAGRPIHEIRTDLKRWVLNNPIPYFKLNKNAKAAVKMNVIDAINYGLIEYNIPKKGYVNLETDELICNHTAAEDPMEKLVKFLSSPDGKEWYDNILERMNYWS